MWVAGSEAKFWLVLSNLAFDYELSNSELNTVAKLIQEYQPTFLQVYKITSPNERPSFMRSYRPTTALTQAVTFDDITMHIQFTDDRTISVPLLWFPRLQAAQPEQRLRVEIGGGGRGQRVSRC